MNLKILLISFIFFPTIYCANPEFNIIKSGNINKKEFKELKIPNLITNFKLSEEVFKKLNIKLKKIDFNKHFIYIETIDLSSIEESNLIKPHYTKDNKYIYIQVLCKLRLKKSNQLKFHIYKISKGKTLGIGYHVRANGQYKLKIIENW